LTVADNDQRSRDGRQSASPGVFILDDPGFHLVGFVWAATPIAFIIIKFFGIQFITQERSDAIVDAISAVWPSMEPQYEFIKRSRPLSEATNYSLFYLSMLIQILAAAAFVITRIKNAPVSIGPPGRGELLVISIGLAVSFYVLFLDPVPGKPDPFYFRTDAIGFYYVRQWMGATAVLMTMVFVLASLLRPRYRRHGEVSER
jgi:hypothetical protein